MAYFCELDENNIVINIIVVDDKELLDQHGLSHEVLGLQFLASLFGTERKFKQVSETQEGDSNYQGLPVCAIGDTYNPIKNIFIYPQPFPSWVLDSNDEWQPPIDRPVNWNEKSYCWDEENTKWIECE